MKKVIFLGSMAAVLAFTACKNDSKKEVTDEATGSTQTAGASEEQKPAAANQPKEYKVGTTPDTAILGKKREALVKITGATAMALTDPDGKDNGIELVLKLTLTNKNQIGQGYGIHMDYTKSRLQLDNGTNITCDHGSDFLRAEPEATSKEEEWTYKIPAGAKPTALNLFMDDTRVSVGVSLSEK
ncbi:hypothetical protein [Longitalea arenae]|uniref:hypothetical protein n=1 Tax=Longitalea arenae TaxID=2812558 RepID=UPI0019685281|nr:hypothetical protein [Longitalea arenae]